MTKIQWKNLSPNVITIRKKPLKKKWTEQEILRVNGSAIGDSRTDAILDEQKPRQKIEGIQK